RHAGDVRVGREGRPDGRDAAGHARRDGRPRRVARRGGRRRRARRRGRRRGAPAGREGHDPGPPSAGGAEAEGLSALSRPFIGRPVATTLLMVAILLAGALGYRRLPVSALPQVDYPTIQVVTFYPGASPDVMASSVTAPLERQFGQMPGLAQMTST